MRGTNMKITCSNFGKAHVVQTVATFLKSYEEHHRAFRNDTNPSKFAQHLNENGRLTGLVTYVHNVII